MDLNVITATEDALIDFCIQRGEKDALVAGVHGAIVVKVTNNIVAKWGWTVTDAEAAMHDFAYKNLDHNIVRVPQVYRFVRDDSGRGYLFMEYIFGQNLAGLDINRHQDIISRVAKIVEHLGQRQAPEQKPGPISDRGPRGYLWGDDGVRKAFGSVTDLNDWLNRRLTLRNDSIDISPYPLVLCHMDLCRRNMILGEDGKSIYLLDWGHAGFFPRFYEVATLSCLNPYDGDYEKPLIGVVESLLQLTDGEKRDMKMVHYARAASLRWSFPEENDNE
ncbi:uncharacterized protein TRUGW13939_06058 [Talaromyces rugulosus]|uniref:Aminoglycoside phosphotransferase domain-containing protein n=1 Tax=Talaromyces rugulosus TaxID=121627 RepID=A0A7H8QXT0_TALRU|nr:uncharacterized protein TRUGW13939_06058 [Talaromyces rugulosus]QKX58930.1 hypothetical protein TRUGW13939_06058 [Talaromyces rugulosus]